MDARELTQQPAAITDSPYKEIMKEKVSIINKYLVNKVFFLINQQISPPPMFLLVDKSVL